MAKYVFMQLSGTGDPEVRASVNVDSDGAITWEPADQQEGIEAFLTNTPFYDEETDDFMPIDVASPAGWERVPRVLSGSYFWCQRMDNDNNAENEPPAQS